METIKKCFKCNEVKNKSEFYKHPGTLDGHLNKCKSCTKKDVKENYKVTIDKRKEYELYRHRYSINRLLLSKYSAIKVRCTTKKQGRSFLDRKDWLHWCYQEDNFKSFMTIYNQWVQSNFQKKFNPSIDRIDNKKGYEIGNMQWLTQSDNSKKYNK